MLRLAPYSTLVFPPANPARKASQSTTGGLLVFAAPAGDWFFVRAITTSFCLLKAGPRYQKQLAFGEDSDIALRAKSHQSLLTFGHFQCPVTPCVRWVLQGLQR